MAPALLGALLLQSCSEDVPTNRTPREGGALGLDSDISGEDDGGGSGSSCPSTQPKVGETCGPGVEDSTSCDFVFGDCTAPNGKVYTEVTTMCCLLGVWEICGGRSPCDDMDASVSPPEEDGGVRDGPHDATDALDGSPG
jgi:hypothetical protein